MALTEDRACLPGSPASARPRFGRITRLWPLIALAIEVVVGWFVIRVDLWSHVYLLPAPVLTVVAVGITLILIPLVLRPRRALTVAEAIATEDPRPRATKLTAGVVATVAICAYFFGLPAKMWVSSTSAINVVDQLLPKVNGLPSGTIKCWSARSDLGAVSALISATRVCAQGPDPGYGNGSQVWWQEWQPRSYSADTLVYSGTPLIGTDRGSVSFPEVCAEHIYGSWWALAQASELGVCPWGYTYTGSP